MNGHLSVATFSFRAEVGWTLPEFLVLFDAIFTLNQDLLLESHYLMPAGIGYGLSLGENDFIECSILRDLNTGANDLWRVSRDGLAALLRNYFEDRSDTAAYIESTPGSFVNPNWLVRDVAELVRHARGLADRFSDATSVAFRCAWHGLEGRVLADLMSRWSPGFRFGEEASYRISTGTWRVSELNDKWSDIVSHLVSPVMRAANCGHVITPSWVSGQQKPPAWRECRVT